MPIDRFDERRTIFEQLLEERADDRPQLREFGMEPIAQISFVGGRMQIDQGDTRFGDQPGVFAFTAAGRVVRLGSAASALEDRIAAFATDINSRLADPDGSKSNCPMWEADLWRYVFDERADGPGEIWIRPSEPVQTAVGRVGPEFACKAEQAAIAPAFRSPSLSHPVLNRSGRIV